MQEYHLVIFRHLFNIMYQFIHFNLFICSLVQLLISLLIYPFFLSLTSNHFFFIVNEYNHIIIYSCYILLAVSHMLNYFRIIEAEQGLLATWASNPTFNDKDKHDVSTFKKSVLSGGPQLGKVYYMKRFFLTS